MFFEFLNYPIEIPHFEKGYEITLKEAKKGIFFVLLDQSELVERWRGYAFSPIVFRYLYAKSKRFRRELKAIAKQEDLTFTEVCECVK